MNTNAILMVGYAPIFLLVNGFWMVDNKIIFENKWDYIMRTTDSMKSGHFFEGFRVNPATPLLLFIMFSIAMKVLTWLPEEFNRMLGFTMDDDFEISVDEDLPNFWEAIKLR